jgi:thiamine kinase-like enzyme
MINDYKCIDEKSIRKSLQEAVISYVTNDLPGQWGIPGKAFLTVERIIIADYNVNVIIRSDGHKFVFRVNVEQQSGMLNQIEYEYDVLRFLEKYNIAPTPCLIDNSKTKLQYGFLIEEFIEGSYLDYDEADGIVEAARLLSFLHQIPLPNKNFFVVWQNPLEQSFKDVEDLVKTYAGRKSRNGKLLSLSKQVIAKLEIIMDRYSKEFTSSSIIHTDVCNDNFIRSPGGLRLIDWEKPRVDDPSYDLCCFLGAPSQLWSSPRTMREEEVDLFFREYCRNGGGALDQMKLKTRIRQPFVSLHWVLWAAIRLADLLDGTISEDLMQFHFGSVDRYKKVASVEHLDMILTDIE